MHSPWFRSTFLSLLKFLQIKWGAPNFLWGTSSAERLSYLVPLLYSNFKSLKNTNSLSFIRFQCISAWFKSTFLKLRLLKLLQIKEGAPNFLRGTNSAELLNYLALLLHFNFKSFKAYNYKTWDGLQL